MLSTFDNGPGIEAGDLNAAMREVQNEAALRALRRQFSKPRLFRNIKQTDQPKARLTEKTTILQLRGYSK